MVFMALCGSVSKHCTHVLLMLYGVIRDYLNRSSFLTFKKDAVGHLKENTHVNTAPCL